MENKHHNSNNNIVDRSDGIFGLEKQFNDRFVDR